MANLETLLDQLGGEEDRIARTLHWAGIEGRRRSTSHCPISNFVRLYYPDAFDVVVTSTHVCVWRDRDSMPALEAQAETPAPVRSFIDAFDHGRYARLREQESAWSDEEWTSVPEAKPADPVRRIAVSI